jgi:hypothetical protein|tara:strand:- start:466 stop:702 length:237 start_codon:yes stop_codon:yes gene_type:complete
LTKRKKKAILAEIGDYVEVYPSTTYHNEPPLRGIVVGYEHNHPFSEKVMVKLDKYSGLVAYAMGQIKILSDKKNGRTL